jgi:Vault protein inter-alpha-trypsin domain/von Willebrand factor type A domain
MKFSHSPSLAAALALSILSGSMSALGCGGAARGPIVSADSPDASPNAAAMRALPALKLELQAVTVRGQLMARTEAGGEWKPLPAGASLAGVRELQAMRRGAVVALGHGDAAGRLWLRAGAAIRLGQDERGIFVGVVSGRARLRRGASSLPVFIDSSLRPFTGDALLETGFAGVTEVAAIGAHPERAAWAIALDRPEQGSGVGRLEAERAASSASPLALRKVTVDIQTAGDLAITSVEHVFHNPAAEDREGTFRFPVPDGALLTGLAMEIHGKLVEGEIVEREKARQIYQKIVDDMQDPALLEWEQGNWFKLRVFPIEASSDKRVIIRYASPLVRGAAGWEAAFSLAAPDGLHAPIGELTVRLDGKQVAHELQVAQGLDLALPVADAAVPPVMREERGDAVYTAVRIGAPKLDSSVVSPAPAPAARRIAIVVDTSRSALESKALAAELLGAALGELAPADRFLVLTSDVAVTPHAADYAAASPEAIAAALAFVARIEPDGASDVGAALTAAAARAPTEVLYLGDGIPTWGERDPSKLAALGGKLGAPIHAGLVGKGASAELWSELAGRSGGRALTVRTSADAARFALAAMHAHTTPRLRNARVAAPAGSSLFPSSATTLYSGDELVVVMRTPKGAALPAKLSLTGETARGPVTTEVSLAQPAAIAHVAQRWAAYQLAALDAAGADREEIVAVSEEFGLMSRHTSLLVLENDEAYKQHQIARRKAEEQAQLAAAAAQAGQAPQVTGGDLDTLGAREASLSPGEIQPGDPEIKIPAPADARSVVVSFPFGETKLAVWDVEAAAWMVRFLIDKDTPDGNYQVRVTITHGDGRIEVLALPYLVDTAAPAVELRVTRVASGYRLRATQLAGADGSRRKDADRIEVVLPDGQILVLPMTRWGLFEGVWQTPPLSEARTLRVVVRDRALNQATRELVIGGGR